MEHALGCLQNRWCRGGALAEARLHMSPQRSGRSRSGAGPPALCSARVSTFPPRTRPPAAHRSSAASCSRHVRMISRAVYGARFESLKLELDALTASSFSGRRQKVTPAEKVPGAMEACSQRNLAVDGLIASDVSCSAKRCTGHLAGSPALIGHVVDAPGLEGA